MDQKQLINQLNQYRREHNVFQRSIDQKSDKFETITYDGPPFASGTPHFGHGLVSAMKDTIGRYKAMKGYKLIRDWGWDCHGLPVEKAVEKKLGIDGKKDIEEKVWIQKFTEECRNYVSNVSDEWTNFVDSIGRWADMDNAYRTMDLDFMESVINVFSRLYDDNMVYKGFKVQRYCPSCATALANNEVNEWYEDRQDAAITVKFELTGFNSQSPVDLDTFEHKDWIVESSIGIIKNSEGKVYMMYRKGQERYKFPWGKVDKGETYEQALEREIKEEIGKNIINKKYLWSCKIVEIGMGYLAHCYEIEIDGEPEIMEKDNFLHAQWVEAIEYDNKLGFAVKIDETIIDDEDDLMREFWILYPYFKKNFIPENENPKIYTLAWTTTPWTLPANAFLATGANIKYAMVFDKSSNEYYILAEWLLNKFYKNPEEYQLIRIFKGEELQGMYYKPLFNYINESSIPQEYKDKYFQIMTADFVSTEDGTGIVHIAPSFGQDDFEAVASKILPRDKSREWLFLPVGDYGEYTDLIPNRKGMSVFEANKEVIKHIKEENKLILQQSYNHSYPHCWRCHTPLISKAMDSWFIKEPSLKPHTLEQAEKIGFVPQAIKKRFIDTLDSAPDRNLSRNRYWGSPIPIWENQNNTEDRIIIESLEDLYQKTRSGSKNITKNIFIRHGRTDFNDAKKFDGLGESILTELGKQQATELPNKLTRLKSENPENLVFVISPLQRTWQTIKPTLLEHFSKEEINEVEKKYFEYYKAYQKAFTDKSLETILQGTDEENRIQLHERIFIDWRFTDHLSFADQAIVQPCDLLNWKDEDKAIGNDGESIKTMEQRIKNALKYRNTTFKTKNIVYVSHNDTIWLARKVFRGFDYSKQRKKYLTKNAEYSIHYRDNDKQAEVDLHRPYVDNYSFVINGNEYKRIPEVMDCWFESGAMPFGQVGYIKTRDGKESSKKPLIYPADFIIEGLDQTRWWFRVMHVIGNAMKKENSYNNVVINGLILAEDGKKMSKSLNNYPDPDYLFGRYGTDAYRLYVLSSPAVRAEPMKFSEKGVDQIYKDFTVSLNNAYKFFETYAKVDTFKYTEKNIYFIRHAKAESQAFDAPLVASWKEQFNDTNFIENIVRLDIDTIYTSPSTRTLQTTEELKNIIKIYGNKEVEIIEEKELRMEGDKELQAFEKIKSQDKGNILIVSHLPILQTLRSEQYGEQITTDIKNLEITKLPSSKLENNLDKRILAELNKLIEAFQTAMDNFALDSWAKTLTDFIEKLTNRYIRRSRRRFRASGMTADKQSAYNTLYEVLLTFTKITASFTPFIAEDLYLKLQDFSEKGRIAWDSVHLQHIPVKSEKYINQELLKEIEMVRKIISLGLFIRAKNNIKVKQPLQSIKIKL